MFQPPVLHTEKETLNFSGENEGEEKSAGRLEESLLIRGKYEQSWGGRVFQEPEGL